MPGSPNSKTVITPTGNRETTLLTVANVKAALRTQNGLEHVQRALEDNTSVPVTVSLSALDSWINLNLTGPQP